MSSLSELRSVQLLIEAWYDQECAKIAVQSQSDDIQHSGKIWIYHNEIHQKFIKNSSILIVDQMAQP